MNLKSLWAKIWTPANKQKAIAAAVKKLDKLAEKEKAKAAKSGEVVVSLLIVAAIGMVLGSVFSSGVNTRSIVHRSQITIKDSSNVVVMVSFGTNTVEVSGSGGVSIPVSAK